MKRFPMSLLMCLLALCATNMDGQSIEALSHSVSSLYAKGKYAEAIPIAEKMIALEKRKFGESSAKLGYFTIRAAILYEQTGGHQKADSLFNAGIKLLRKHGATQNPNYSNALSVYAIKKRKAGEFEEALSIYNEIIKIDSISIGVRHPDFALHLIGLANIYVEMKSYDMAIITLLAVLENESIVIGEKLKNQIIDLALFYWEVGNLRMADHLYHALQKIMGRSTSKMGQRMSTIVEKLPLYFMNIAKLQKTSSIYLEILDYDRDVFFMEHFSFASHLKNAGWTKSHLKDYEKMLSLYLHAIRTTKNKLGYDHPKHGRLLNNVGCLLNRIGEPKLALKYNKAALAIMCSSFKKEHLVGTTTLNNLATTLTNLGAYSQADSLYKSAIAIEVKAGRKISTKYVTLLQNLVFLQFKSGNGKRSEAKRLIDEAFVIFREYSRALMGMYPSRQRAAYWFQNEQQFSFVHSLVFFRKHPQANLTGIGFESVLFQKAILLRAEQAYRRATSDNHDLEASRKLESLKLYKRQVLKMDAQSDDQIVNPFASLKDRVDQEIRTLLRDNSRFRTSHSDLIVNWLEVHRSLDNTSAAIEFTNFPFFDGEKLSGYWYGAYILKKGDTLPKFVGLCPADSLQNALGSERETSNAEEYVDQLYGSRGVVPGKSTTKPSQKLYDLIWEPLDSLLEGITTVYFAPAGILHNVAFAALPVTESTVLSDRYRLVQMGTTGTLTKGRKDLYASQLENAALFGGMDFDLDSASIRKGERAVGLSRGGHENKAVTLPSGLVVSPWKGLAGTQKECDAVAGYLKSVRVLAVAHTGAAASEGVFGSLEGEYLPDQVRKTSPGLIHVATHGFSIPIRPRPGDFSGFGNQVERYHWSEDPLRRAGLIFSGANHVWTGHAAPAGMADGILSAAEVSLMDLSDTRLVVLSACQTGLGDIVGNEGVFGLQRAFKLAGVELVVASLWRVPDKETVEFMELFYGNFVAGMEVREAFRGAQEVMKEKYRGEPYKWAAFVLME